MSSSQSSAPRSYGSDRVQQHASSVTIESAHAKGWRGRRSAPRGEREFPGTAVQWEDSLYEVIAVERSATGWLYTLQPWRQEHAVRAADTYDDASEQARSAARAQQARDTGTRRKLSAMAFLVGFLPGYVQEHLHLRFGTAPLLPTYLSLAPLFVLGFISLIFFMTGALGASTFGWLLLLGVYFFGESLVRFALAMSTGRPSGSLPGILGYEIWRALKGKSYASLSTDLATSVELEADEARLGRDRLLLVEPLVTLLPRAEQLTIEERFARDLARIGQNTAMVLLVLILVTIAGQTYAMTNAPSTASRFVALLFNLYLAGEQVLRISDYKRGEIRGSVLGVILAPLLLRFLR